MWQLKTFGKVSLVYSVSSLNSLIEMSKSDSQCPKSDSEQSCQVVKNMADKVSKRVNFGKRRQFSSNLTWQFKRQCLQKCTICQSLIQSVWDLKNPVKMSKTCEIKIESRCQKWSILGKITVLFCKLTSLSKLTLDSWKILEILICKSRDQNLTIFSKFATFFGPEFGNFHF